MAPTAVVNAGGWVKREAPELFKFTRDTPALEGRLIAVSKIEITDKESGELRDVTQYVVERTSDRSRVKFLGTFDIDQKLSASDKGCLVRLRYTGDDPKANGMKVYEIAVKDDRVQNPNGLEITDDDLPPGF